jgi:hypothetical protein
MKSLQHMLLQLKNMNDNKDNFTLMFCISSNLNLQDNLYALVFLLIYQNYFSNVFGLTEVGLFLFENLFF